jgi:hypothetical protein
MGRSIDWSAAVRFPAGTRDISLLYSVDKGFGAQLASYPIDNGASFPRDKAAAARSSLTSINSGANPIPRPSWYSTQLLKLGDHLCRI